MNNTKTCKKRQKKRCNMYYTKYNRKKELIKNILTIVFILVLAIFSTRYIYNSINNETEID